MTGIPLTDREITEMQAALHAFDEPEIEQPVEPVESEQGELF